jgi:hypothetical protein
MQPNLAPGKIPRPAPEAGENVLESKRLGIIDGGSGFFRGAKVD